MRAAFCLLALLLLAFWTPMEAVNTDQWNFDKITTHIGHLVKEWSGRGEGIFFTVERHLKGKAGKGAIIGALEGLTKELAKNPREYRQIAAKLEPLENFAKNGNKKEGARSFVQFRLEIGHLLRAIRLQFMLGLPFEQLTKIKEELDKAKRDLEEEGKMCQLATEFRVKFQALLDHVRQKFARIEQFKRKHLPTLSRTFPEFVAGFDTDAGHFKPKWMSEEEREEINEKMAHFGVPNSKEGEALKQLHELRADINFLVVTAAKGVNGHIQQMKKADHDETMANAIDYESVRVYASFGARLIKLGQTLLKIASFGQFTVEGVAKQADGRKLMAMACLLHTQWILPFLERVEGLQAQRKGEMGKLLAKRKSSFQIIVAEGKIKTQSARILSLFETLESGFKFKMCENMAKPSAEGRKARLEAWTELAAMTKARDIPKTAKGEYGLVYYQMFLDRL